MDFPDRHERFGTETSALEATTRNVLTEMCKVVREP